MARPVVGQRLHSRTTNPARQVDVDRWDELRALIDGAPTHIENLGGRPFLVRVLPDAIDPQPDPSRPVSDSHTPLRFCIRIA